MNRTDTEIVGEVRHSENRARRIDGSIHDDATAKRLGLGFKGGTVAGSIHFELFPPVLIEAFGSRWFERGSLSIMFRQPTTDKEPVRAALGIPTTGTDEQVGAWIRRYPNDILVGEGTAACGNPPEPTFLQAKDKHFCDPGELRILADVVPGSEQDHGEAMVTSERIDQMLTGGGMSDTIEWYEGGSPWGGRIVPITAAFNILRAPVINYIGKIQRGKATGLFGAIEMRYVNGPVKPDTQYHVSSRILGVGQTDKTEFCWFDSFLDDSDGKRIAELTFMTRRVKKGSAAWENEVSGTNVN